MQRRFFLKVAGLTLPLMPRAEKLLNINGKPDKGPIVVSTWDFGREANAASWKILSAGGRAVDAIEEGAHVPENDPKNQTVGYGGLPDRDGRVTLDACIMDENGNCGSVMCLEFIRHPISVARKVMEKTPHIVLVGDGALKFALENGFTKENLLTPESERAWRKWLKESKYEPRINIENESLRQQPPMPGGKDNHDTIGMLARDSSGNLSGGCTTSGMAFKLPGRVGDSPIIGAGLLGRCSHGHRRWGRSHSLCRAAPGRGTHASGYVAGKSLSQGRRTHRQPRPGEGQEHPGWVPCTAPKRQLWWLCAP